MDSRLAAFNNNNFGFQAASSTSETPSNGLENCRSRMSAMEQVYPAQLVNQQNDQDIFPTATIGQNTIAIAPSIQPVTIQPVTTPSIIPSIKDDDILQRAGLDPSKVKVIRTGVPCFCGERFGNKASLQRHQRKSHKKPARFGVYELKCNLCDTKFLKPQAMERHVLNSHKPGGPTCQDCGIPFISARSLSIHRRDAHGHRLPTKSHSSISFTCKLCGYNTKWKGNMRTHMKKILHQRQDT